MSRTRTYAISGVVMLALDLLWLGVLAPPFYQRFIGPLMRPQPDLVAATLFYLIYVVGVNEFVLHALPRGTPTRQAALRGALFGFVAYATFDLTAQAVLRGWSPVVTLVDMAWGTALTATVAGVTQRLSGRARAIGPR